MSIGRGASIIGMQGRAGMNINGKVYNFKPSDRIDIRDGIMYVNGSVYKDGVTKSKEFSLTGVPDTTRTFKCGNALVKTGEEESWKLTGTVYGESDADMDAQIAAIDWKDSTFDLEMVVKEGGDLDVVFSGSCDVEGGGKFDDVRTNSTNGNVRFTGTAKRLDAKSVNGNIRATKSEIGTFHAKTVNGSVNVRNCTIANNSYVKTVNGSIDLFLLHPAIIQTQLNFRGVKKCTTGPKIQVSTVNGDVSFDFEEKEDSTVSKRSRTTE